MSNCTVDYARMNFSLVHWSEFKTILILLAVKCAAERVLTHTAHTPIVRVHSNTTKICIYASLGRIIIIIFIKRDVAPNALVAVYFSPNCYFAGLLSMH